MAAARHRSRRRALQMLFEWDMRGDVDQAIAHHYLMQSEEGEAEVPPDPFAEELVRGTVAKRAEIDPIIEAKSERWKLDRMPVVDRNILRLGIFELMQASVPAVIAIDEAMALARQFSNDESLPFINGLLDSVHRDGQFAQKVQSAD